MERGITVGDGLDHRGRIQLNYLQKTEDSLVPLLQRVGLEYRIWDKYTAFRQAICRTESDTFDG